MNPGRALARMAGMFHAPVATFKEMAGSPTFLAPFLLIVALSAVAGVIATPYIDWEGTIREQFESAGVEVPEEQVQQTIAQQKEWGERLAPVTAPVGGAVMLAFLALIWWGGANAMGGTLGFKGAMAIICHAWVVKLVESVLFLVLIQGQDPMPASRFGTVVASSPAALLGPEAAGTALAGFLGTLNVFTLWVMALAVIGLSEIGRLSRGAALAVVGVPFGIYVAGATALAALF